MTGHGRTGPDMAGRTLDPAFSLSQKKRRPPKNRLKLDPPYTFIFGKSAHLSPIEYKDLAAQIDVLPYMFLNP